MGQITSVTPRPRVRVCLFNEFDVTVRGIEASARQFAPDIEFFAADLGDTIEGWVDVVLFDPTTLPAARRWEPLIGLSESPNVGVLAIYAGHLPDAWIEQGLAHGASTYLSKSLLPDALYDALVDLAQSVGSDARAGARRDTWPGQGFGLTRREAGTLALVAQGLSNVEIAERMMLSQNTVKTYIRSAYRTIGVTSRSQAVLWAVRHGVSTYAP